MLMYELMFIMLIIIIFIWNAISYVNNIIIMMRITIMLMTIVQDKCNSDSNDDNNFN